MLWELEGSSKPPPCFGVLAVLSLVAERMKQTEEFAGSNYYGRLLQALDVDAEFRDQVGRDFRKETPRLWNTLNRWLEDSNGRRGLPTAVAFDRRRFIGLPLSQALVRAQDRTKLPVLFTQFGLQSGQRISVQAMQELLSEWIPGSQVTQSLKRPVVEAVQQGTNLGGRVRRAGRLGRRAAKRSQARGPQTGRQPLSGCGA